MIESAGQTLPPDPSVPGRWWMRHERDQAWSVWQWWPSDEPLCWGQWVAHGGPFLPHEAQAAGWRVHSQAVPPDKLAEAATTLTETRDMLTNLSGRTLDDDECLLAARENVDEVLGMLGRVEMPEVQP